VDCQRQAIKLKEEYITTLAEYPHKCIKAGKEPPFLDLHVEIEERNEPGIRSKEPLHKSIFSCMFRCKPLICIDRSVEKMSYSDHP